MIRKLLNFRAWQQFSAFLKKRERACKNPQLAGTAARRLVEPLEDRVAPATLTWVGDQDANWNTSNLGNTNWLGDVLPTSGDTLIFAGAGPFVLNNDTLVGNNYILQFTAGGYTLSGNLITLGPAGDLAASDDIIDSAGGNTINLDLSLAGTNPTVNVSTGTDTIGGQLSGGSEFWKDGAGTVVLTNAGNVHTNSNVIRAGTLDIADFGALGGGNLFIGQGGSGTFKYTGGTTSTSKIGAFALQGAGANSFIEITNAATSLTLTAAVGNNGGGKGFTKTGNGTLNLSGGISTYDGPTAINAGTLEIGASGGGGINTASTITVNNTGALKLSRNDIWGNHITITSSPIIVNAGGTLATNNTFNTLVNLTLNGGTVTLNGGVNADFPALALKGTVTVGGTQASQINAGSGSFNVISIGDTGAPGATTFNVADATGNANVDLIINVPLKDNRNDPNTANQPSTLAKSGAGTLASNGASTYTGGTTMTGGSIQAGDNSAFGTGQITMNSGAARVFVNNFTLPNNIVINAGVAPGVGLGAITGPGTITGTAGINAGTTNGGHIDGGAGLTFTNTITAAAAVQVAQRVGTVNYNNTITATAGMAITGVANWGASDILTSGAPLNISASGAGTLNLTTFNQALGAVTFTGNGGAGSITTTTGTLTLNGDVSSAGNFTHSISGNLNLGGVTRTFTVADGTNANDFNIAAVVSNGAFTKAGAGTLTLAGTGASANTYTGLTTVSAGILIAGAGFAGDGGILGDITVNAGEFRLGQSNIIVNGSDITIAGGATFNMNALSDAFGNLGGAGSITGNSNATGIILDDLAGNRVFSGSIAGAGGLFLRSNNSGGSQEFSGTLTLGTVTVRSFAAATNSTLILNGATVTATSFSVGDTNNGAASGALQGLVTQTGGSVTVSALFRIGHWPNGTSSYTMNSGALTLTGVPGAQVNQAAAAEQNGIIYLGVDGTGTFTQSAGTVVAKGVVLDARGDTAGVDTLTLNGGTMTLGNTADTTRGGIFAGTSDANTTYLININGGTLSAQANWATSRLMALTGAGGVTFNTNGFGITYSGAAISGAFPLVKSGAGDLIFSNAATTNAATTITVQLGRLFFLSQTNLNSAATPITIQNGGTIDYNTNGADLTIANPITVQSGGNIASRRTGGTFTLSGIITLPTTGTAIFNKDDAATGTITMNNAANAIAMTGDLIIQIGNSGFETDINLRNAVGAGQVNLVHAISGNFNLAKTGGGTLALTNAAANTFGGAGKTVAILGGNLSVARDNLLGNAANTIAFANPRTAALNVIGGTTPENQLNKQFDLQTGNANFSALWTGSFTTTAAGDYTFGTDSDDGSVIYVDINNNGVFESPGERIVNNNGSHGAGTPQIGVATALAGGTTYRVAIGMFQGTGGGSIQAKWGAGSIATYAAIPNIVDPAGQATVWSSLHGAGTLEERVYAGAPPATAGTPGTGPFLDPIAVFPGLFAQAPTPTGLLNITATFSSARNFVMNAQGGVNVNGGITFTTTGTISTLGTFVGLNGGLTKTGTGTMILGNNANTYTGPTVMRSGVLQATVIGNAGGNTALGNTTNAPGNLVFDGGTLQYNGAVAAVTDRQFTITLNGGTLDNSSPLATSTLSFTTTTTPQLTGSGTRTFNLGGSNAGANTFITPLSANGGATNLTKTGAGTWRYGANDLVPDNSTLTVAGGTLDIQTFTDTVTNYTHSGAGTFTGSTGVITATGTVDLRDGFITGGKISAPTITKNTSQGFDVFSANAFSGAANIVVATGSLNFGAVGTANSASQTLGTVTINNGGALHVFSSGTITSGVVTINNFGTLWGDAGAGNTATWTTSSVVNNGGTLTVSSGTLDFGGASVISNTAPVLANALDARMFEVRTGFPVNTDAGILAALNAVPSNRFLNTAAVSFANDAAFGTAFGNTNAGGNLTNFTTLWTGTFTVTVAGAHQFSLPTHDDGSAIWVDLNNNGIFESGAGELALNAPGTAAATNAAFNIPSIGTYRIAIIQEDTGGGSSLIAQFAEPAGGTVTALTAIQPNAGAQAGKWNVAAGTSAPVINIHPGATLVTGSVTGSPTVNLTNAGLQERIYRAQTGTALGANEVGNGASPNNTIDPTLNALSLLNKTPYTVFTSPGALNMGIAAGGGVFFNDRSGGIIGVNQDNYGTVIQGRITLGGSNLAAGANTFGLFSDDNSTLFIDSNSNGIFEATEKVVSANVGNAIGTVTLAAGTYNFAVAMQEGGGGDYLTVRYGQGTGFANFAALPNIVNPTAASQAGIWSLPGTGNGTLKLTAAGATVDTINNVNITGINMLGAIDTGANNTLNVATLNVGAGSLLSKTGGTGALNLTTSQIIGTGGAISINAGTAVQTGIASDAGSIGTGGTGLLTMFGTGNTYGGSTFTNGGTLKLGASGVIPDGAGKGNVLSVAGIFDLNGFDETINGLSSLNGGGTVTNTAAAPVTLFVGNNNTTSFFAGNITNSGGDLSLNKSGTGTLFLAGNNTYSGTTDITQGTITTQSSLQFFRFTATKLRGPNPNSIQLSEMQVFNGTSQLSGATATNPGGNNPGGETPAQAVDNNVNTKWLDFNVLPLVLDFGSSQINDRFTWATANDAQERDAVRWRFEGSADGTNWVTLQDQTQSDFATTTARNTFLPQFQYVNATPNAIPDGSAVTVAAGATLNIAGVDETIGSLTGPAGSSVTLGAGTLTAGGNGDTTTFDGVISGTGGLTKNGGGTLTLTSPNTFTGTTNIDDGTLELLGTLNTGAVNVNNNGTLTGTGSLGGALNVNAGGTVNPGTVGTAGTLTVGALNFNGGTYAADLIGTANDLINTVSANAAALAQGVFALNDLSALVPAGTTFTFISNTGLAAFANPPLAGAIPATLYTIDGQNAAYSYSGNDGNDFTLTVENSITVNGTGGDDNFEVRRVTGPGSDDIQVFLGGLLVSTTPYAVLTSLTINALGSNDNLFINYGGSGGFYETPIAYNGNGQTAAPGDTITIGGTTVDSVTYDFINDNDGNILVEVGLLIHSIQYAGIEPILDNLVAVSRTFNYLGGAETVTLSDDLVLNDDYSFIDSTLGESVTFLNPTASLTVNVTGGGDTLNVEGLDAQFDANFTATGDGGDTLNFQTNATGLGSGNLAVSDFVDANFNATVTTTGNASIAVTNTVTDGNGATLNLAAGDVTIDAIAGINLDTAISGLEAQTLTGGISIDNTGALTIGGLDINLFGVQAGISGDIVLTATGTVTIAVTNDTVTTPGAVTITASGAASDILTSGGHSAISGEDAIVLTAGRDVILGTAASLNDYGDVDGSTSIIVNAGRDVTVQSFTYLGVDVAGALNVTAGRDISVLTGFAGSNAARINTRGGVITLIAGGNFTTSASDGLNNDTVDSTLLGLSPGANINITAQAMSLGDNIQAGTGTATLIATTGAITDTNGAANNVTAASLVASAITGIASSANPLETIVDTLTATTTNSDQYFTEANGITALSASAGTGAAGVTLTLGSLLDTDAATDITAASTIITLNGAGETIGTGANNIQTDVNSLTTLTSNGNQFITESNALAALDMNAGTGDIVLTLTAGGISDTDLLVDVTANDFTVTAPGTIGSAGSPIGTSVDTLTTTTTNSNQFYRESNGITALNASSGTAFFNIIVAAGSLLDGDAAVDVVAGTTSLVTLGAGATIGTGTGPGAAIQTNTNQLSTQSNNGNQFIEETNGVTAESLIAGVSGDIVLTLLAGSVTDVDAFTDALADELTVTAPGGVGTAANRFQTSVNSLTITTTNNDAYVTESAGLTQLNINTGTADAFVTLLAGAIADTDAGIDVTANDTTLVAPAGIGSLLNRLQTNVDTLTSTTTNTNQFFDESNGLTALNAAAGTGNFAIRLLAGSLLDGDGATDIVANIAAIQTLGAAETIGTLANPIQTSIAELITQSNNGDQFVTESNGLTQISLNANNDAGIGDITLTLTAGAVTDTDALTDIIADGVTVTTPSGIGTGANSIQTSVNSLTTTTTNTDQFITENNGLTQANVNSGTGTANVTLTLGSLLDTDAGVDFAGNANINILTTGETIGTGANSIQTDVNSLTATTIAGNQYFTESTGLTQLNLDAGLADPGNGDIVLVNLAGTITDTDAGVDVNADDFTVISAGAIGTLANRIRTDIVTLTSSTANSDQFFLEDIALNAISASAGTANINLLLAAGALSDLDAANDVAANIFTVNAPAGVGTLVNPIATTVSFLNATASTAGIFVDNTGPLDVTGATTGAGNIVINNFGADNGATVTIIGDMTVSGTVSTPGNITLTAHEIDDNLDTPPPYTNNLTVNSNVTGNAVTLRAGDDLIIGSTSVVTSTGGMTLFSGYNDLDMYGNVIINGTINPGGGLTLISYGDIVFGPPAIPGTPVINAPGIDITLTSLNGSIYDNNDNQTPNSSPIAPLFVIDVVANNLTLNAPNGSVGEVGDTIETVANTLSATAGTTFTVPAPGVNAAVAVQRSVEVWNTTALAVNSITDAGGVIGIWSEGSMTVNGPVTQSTGGDIDLFAVGAASDLTLVGTVSATDSGGPLGGDITMSAGDQMLLGPNFIEIITEGNSTVTLNAGWPNQPDPLPSNPSADLVLNASLNLGASDLILTAPRHVILDGANADITTTGAFIVFADRDNSQIGTGGTFIQNNLDSTVLASSADITAADIQLIGQINAGTGDIEVTTQDQASNIYLNNIRNVATTGMEISLTDLLALRTDGGTITIGKDYDTGDEVEGTIFIGGLGTVGVGLINADYEIFGGLIDFNGGIVIADNRIIRLDSDTDITPAGSGFVDVTARGNDGTLVVRAGSDATLSTIVTNLGQTLPIDDPSFAGDKFILDNNNFDLDVAGTLTAESVDIKTGTATLTVSREITATPLPDGHVTITADGINLNADISGGGILTLRGAIAATTMGFGDNAAGQHNLDDVEVAHLLDGFTRIQIGYEGQTGTIDFVAPVGGQLVFHDPMRINASTVVGAVEIKDGILAGDDDGAFSITAGTLRFLPLIQLPVPSSTLTGLQTDGGNIETHATTILGIDTDIGSNGGSIRLFGTIDGRFDFDVNAGAGPVLINGNPTGAPTGTSVGGNNVLDTITVTGGLVELRPNMKSAGPQTYTGTDIQLIGGAFRTNNDGALITPGDITFNGPVTLQNNIALGTTNSAVIFNGTVDNIANPATAAGKGALRIDTVGGSVEFNEDVGSTFGLKSVDITNAGIITIGDDAGDSFLTLNFLKMVTDEFDAQGDISVPGGIITLNARSAATGIEIGGAETIGSPDMELSDTDVAAFGDGATSILIGRQLGNAPITIASPVTFSDPVTFQQPAKVGGLIYVNADLTGDTANGGFTFKGPGTRLNADIITTGGGAVDIENPVIEAALATVDTSAGNGPVTLRGVMKSVVGGEDFTITTGSGNITVTTGTTVLGSAPIMGVLTLTSSGDTRLDRGLTVGGLVVDGGGNTFLKGRIITMDADGQTYGDAVQLLGSTDLHSRHADGLVQFLGTVDSNLATPTKAFNLAVTNRVVPPSGITVSFDEAIGQTQALGVFRINTTGDANLDPDADVNAKSVNIRARNFTMHDVTTSGAQVYTASGIPSFLGAINALKITVTSATDVTSNAPWNVSGLATINAKGSSIDVTGGGNHFGELVLRGASATIEEDGNMALKYVSLTGTLDLTTNVFGLETGDITQTSSRTSAFRLEVNSAGSLSFVRPDTRMHEVGEIVAGGPVSLLLRGPSYILLDGPITANGDILLVADPNGTAGSFRTGGVNVSINPIGGRFVVFSYYAEYGGDGTILADQLGTDAEFSGALHPSPLPPTDNILMYFQLRKNI